MIFKRWFKPKWQHENPTIRQLAIAELDQQTPEQKEILHELAFNDGTEAVRRAALERLNEFSLWWQASKHESADRLKQFAEQQLVQMLLDNRVSAQLKQQFIAECHRSSVLEKLATCETDAELKLQLLLRLQRQDLYLAALQDPVLSLTQKQSLFSLIADDKALEKASRHCSAELVQLLQTELSHRQEQKQKPERLRKQLTLVLARLNAVRERTDITQAQQQWAELQQKWAAIEPDLQVLSAEEANEALQKYQRIVQLTEAMLAPRLAVLAAEQAKQQHQAHQQKLLQQFTQQLQMLQQQTGSLIAEGDLNAATAQQQALDTLTAQIRAEQPDPAVLQALEQRIGQLQQQLDQLPLLAEALAQAARLLAELSAQPLPVAAQAEKAYQGFKDWQKHWQQVSRSAGALLPQQFSDSYQALVQQWREHCEPLLAQQQRQIRQLRSKLAEFKRLHAEGRFKVLFGLWKGIQQELTELNPEQLAQVEKDLQLCGEMIAELTDLQAYIATPRKQALIAEMQQLLDEPAVSINERATRIKQARAQWNSLGRADAVLEETLNQQFNQLSEQAFAPCRDFYAAQDQQRAQAEVARQQIIATLLQAQANPPQGRELDMLLQQQQQRWQQAGAVSREHFAMLQQAYKAAVQPLKQLQQDAWQQAAEAKQQLIVQAKQLAENAGGPQVEQVKQLQQQWKLLGFAGNRVDQQLWTEFRAACDAFFARRQQQRDEETAQLNVWRQQVSALLAAVSSLELTSLTESQLREQLQQLNDVDTADDKALRQQQQQLRQQLTGQLAALEKQAEAGQYQQLFSALTKPDVQAADLPALYRLVFNQQQETMSRVDLTLALEWAAGQPSPVALAGDRQRVQMQLLSDKHNSGDNLSQNELLGRWLQHGPLQVDEADLLARVRSLYLA
ncbi:DUF349 domain-containing protein [Rheinheimera tilapiae]|uniref:DUF349 domain-containing protein n=1 Tax=Rheinheimera tilapiae TaxID=875043 RepID=A0ABV6BFA6_9GAMM